MRLINYTLWKITLSLTIISFIVFPLFKNIYLLLLLLHFLVLTWGVFNIKSQFFYKTYCSNKQKKDSISLTFDDGPDPNLTNDILKLLKKYFTTATFFIVADKAKKYPNILKTIVSEGHSIGCHDLHHSPYSNFRLTKQSTNEISEALKIINNIIGKKTFLYRPPVGLMNPQIAKSIGKLNLHCIGWNKSASDMGNRRLKNIKKIKNLASEGSVIMMHDCLPNAEYKEVILSQIELLLISIKEQNIKTISVNEMFDI